MVKLSLLRPLLPISAASPLKSSNWVLGDHLHFYSRQARRNGEAEASEATFAYIRGQPTKILKLRVLKPLLPMSMASPPKYSNWCFWSRFRQYQQPAHDWACDAPRQTTCLDKAARRRCSRKLARLRCSLIHFTLFRYSLRNAVRRTCSRKLARPHCRLPLFTLLLSTSNMYMLGLTQVCIPIYSWSTADGALFIG